MNALAEPILQADERPIDLIRDTRIQIVETQILDVPTIRKHQLSNTAVTHQSYVHVSVRLTNGVVGHGEAATLGGPRWAEESVEAIKANIDTYLGPALIDHPACYIEAANIRMDKVAKRNFAAKSALNAALLDGVGVTLNVPAAFLLGGPVRDRIPAIWALASGDAGQEVDEAMAKLEARQFRRFKIKLGFADAEADLSRIRRLRRDLPDGTTIIADVNQAWDEAAALRLLPALADLNVDLIEQPLPAGQFAGMVRLGKRSPIPLMLDEAVFTPEEAAAGVLSAAGSVLSLKLCKHGSAQALQRVAGIATAGGVQLYGGCLLESSLGAAAHMAVFATLPKLQWGTEQFGPLILRNDTTYESLTYREFCVQLPSGPGLGVRPNPEAIAQFARKQ